MSNIKKAVEKIINTNVDIIVAYTNDWYSGWLGEGKKEMLEELTTLIDKVREEDWTTIHRAIIDALFSVNKRYSKDDVGLEGYGYNKGINKAISKLNQLLDLSEQYLQSIKEESK